MLRLLEMTRGLFGEAGLNVITNGIWQMALDKQRSSALAWFPDLTQSHLLSDVTTRHFYIIRR